MKVLDVENIGKQYRLGLVGTGTLSHDLNRFWAKVRGKEDPYLKIGDVNYRSKSGGSDYVWALKDISFSVNHGEVLGIVGKNGAGKSTLLKVLSRITSPTVGTIKGVGRVASLLEVGTGFHPELTGRENVFLNGAILGMKKREVALKLDEIIAFSEIEKYIDTPVKRYSSGMYVRLAFAVAAHLEPELLIIDEVLAVGDAEFRKKCVEKMNQVAGEGRTVLFVSHHMEAVRGLCTRGIYLEHGQLTLDGSVDDVIKKYIQTGKDAVDIQTGIVPANWERPWGHSDASFRTVKLLDSKGEQTSHLKFREMFSVEVTFDCERDINDVIFQIRIANLEGMQITRTMSNHDLEGELNVKKGENRFTISLDTKLIPNEYCFNIYLGSRDSTKFYDAIAGFYHFKVLNQAIDGYHEMSANQNTLIHLSADWKIE
jgi:lipopolysaccharide transport system ATP-binding protein